MKTEDIVKAIVKEQSQIIGDSLAIQMAQRSGAVSFNSLKIEDLTITITDTNEVFTRLIESYKGLFGEASAEVCRTVIKRHSNSSNTGTRLNG